LGRLSSFTSASAASMHSDNRVPSESSATMVQSERVAGSRSSRAGMSVSITVAAFGMTSLSDACPY